MRDGRSFGWHVPQLVPFARAFSRCAFRPAVARAAPLYALAVLVSGAPVGALIRAATAEPLALPGLAALWVLALARVCAPLFGAAQTEYLRSLPVAGPMVVVAVLAALICIDAPWIWLCAATGDPALAVAGPALALAGHTALASRRRTHLIALVGILGLAGAVPLAWIVPPALWLAGAALLWAWMASPAPRFARGPRGHTAVPWIAIARALVTSVVRTDTELLRRSIAVLALMTAVAALVVRNNHLAATEPVVVACLTVLALGAPMLVVRVAARVLEEGWTLGWIYDATGARPVDRTLGGLAVALACGGTLGLLHGIAVAMWSDARLIAPLAAAGGVAGAGIGVVMLGVGAAAVTARGVDPLRLISGIVATTTIAAFVVAAGLWAAVIVGAPATLFAALLYHLRVVRTDPCS